MDNGLQTNNIKLLTFLSSSLVPLPGVITSSYALVVRLGGIFRHSYDNKNVFFF